MLVAGGLAVVYCVMIYCSVLLCFIRLYYSAVGFGLGLLKAFALVDNSVADYVFLWL